LASSTAKSAVVLHLFLEINEAADACLKVSSLKAFESVDILQLEMADVIAWFFALLNVANLKDGFEEKFFGVFNSKCYKCHLTTCRCDEVTNEIDLVNWRPFPT